MKSFLQEPFCNQKVGTEVNSKVRLRLKELGSGSATLIFNAHGAQIPDQDSARRAKPGDPFTFTVDASKSGWGEVAIDVVFDNKSIRRKVGRKQMLRISQYG